MVHFFGIFGPGPLVRTETDEAPAKANFFGGLPEAVADDVPSRLELEADYLSGKAPEPAPRDLADGRVDGMPER